MKLRYIKTIEGCYPIKGKTVIDIGCGPGHYGITLAKKGAKFIYGIDFARGMVDIAEQNAKHSDVKDNCSFVFGDFVNYETKDKYDYSIVVGFMDYMKEPKKVIEKVLYITKSKAFFSFPVNGGILALQRKFRYRKRCDLFMYNMDQLETLFSDMTYKKIKYERIARDFFVTVSIK